MAEDNDKESKTEEATPRKIEDAIQKGNTPVSREVAQFASIMGVALLVPVAANQFSGDVVMSLAMLLDRPADFRLDIGEDAVMLLFEVGQIIAKALAPPLLVLMVLGIMASLLQNPFRMVLDRIKPNFSRISLTQGLTRMFGVHGRVEFVKVILKLVVLSTVVIGFLIHYKFALVNSVLVDPRSLPSLLASNISALFLTVGLLLAAIVAADIFWSRLKWQIDLRMSKQEVKEEHKQSEGDPVVRARQRSLARDRARRRMIAAVPRATVVIANPTHYAVALRYVRHESSTPIVVAKGVDNIALRIREIAEEHDIPVIEDKALARSLYAAVVPDRPIPPEFYKAVAEIVIFLMSRSGGPAALMSRGA